MADGRDLRGRKEKTSGRTLRLSPEEEYLQSLSPVDAYRFAQEAQNARRYTPEEASANLKQTGMDLAYVTPIVGNILSAKDAYTYGKDTLNATNDTDRRKNALLTELSALGAITGLPFGNAASRAARGATSRTNAFVGPMDEIADRPAIDLIDAGVHKSGAIDYPRFHINVDGQPTGSIMGRIAPDDPKTFNIEWIGGSEGVSTFGPTQIRGILQALKQKYPEIENVAGLRESGANPFRLVKQKLTQDTPDEQQIVRYNSGGKQMSGEPAVSPVKNVDPNSLIFREAEQNNTSAVRDLYPAGEGYDPIVIARTEDGPLILDGHNRAAVAIERGDHIPTVEIDGATYQKLLAQGWDETDISHAVLDQAGLNDAASGIRQKFPGVDFWTSSGKIQEILGQ